MNNQIKARGWLWDRSEKPTQWLAYECVKCGKTFIYPRLKFKRNCAGCNATMMPYGYVRKAREIK